MADYVLVLKWLHIISSTLLFGTGLGTAFFLWSAHLTRNAALIAGVGKIVVAADFLFTLTAGIVQPLTGLMLMAQNNHPVDSPWLVKSYILYGVAFFCWLPVIFLQMHMTSLAATAAKDKTELPAAYFKSARIWFWLGWPAFISVLVIFWLMVFKPA